MDCCSISKGLNSLNFNLQKINVSRETGIITIMNTSIKAFSYTQLTSLMRECNQPAFRAKQIFEWLYLHHVTSYEDMTTLPSALRTFLSEHFPLYTPSLIDRQISTDGTRKYLLSYHDGACVETVAIPSPDNKRLTVCFSTQVGCTLSCTFCATGKEGFSRNLLPGEIVDQIFVVQEDIGTRVTNIVGMGQGEPFLNYHNTLAALRILNNSKGLAIGARHISISTCGIIPNIIQFSKEPEQFTLAISLHAANQQKRNMLMPKIARYSLDDLKKTLRYYIEQTNRRITLEYIMIKGVNDTPEDLNCLHSFCHELLCHVNLIPINTVSESQFQPSNLKTLKYWIHSLQNSGVEATIRNSRGADIDGACGQLKNTLHTPLKYIREDLSQK